MFGIQKQRERIDTLELEVTKLQAKVRELRAQRRDLLTEWEATFEKFNALWARLAKRLKQHDPKPYESSQDAPGATNDDGPRVNPLAIALLTGRQR